jgi:biotin transporter BioY
MKVTTSHIALIDALIARRSLLLDVVLVLGFACFTAACAQVSFWIGPVPITGQIFGVLLAGAFLGSRRGALSQLSYLAIGATGIPYWFALGGPPGIARLIGPTGGYLIGFVAAAFIVGLLMERSWDRKSWTSILAMLCGSITIYVFGLSWLARFVPQSNILQVGLYPFIIGDLFKIVLAAFVVRGGWSLLQQYKGK